MVVGASTKKLTKKEFDRADVRIRRSFGLGPTTSLVLPHGPSRTWIVELGALNEDQVTAVLLAAGAAGVPLDQPWQVRLATEGAESR